MPATFVNLVFQEFLLNWWSNLLFCIVGTSWMGWGRVEWDWHMGMSYIFDTLDAFQKYCMWWVFHAFFSSSFFLHVFYNLTKSLTNSSATYINISQLNDVTDYINIKYHIPTWCFSAYRRQQFSDQKWTTNSGFRTNGSYFASNLDCGVNFLKKQAWCG